jgi:hypothetical protein
MHRESITERSAGGPVANVTRTKNHTRLLSVAVVQSLSCKISVASQSAAVQGRMERKRRFRLAGRQRALGIMDTMGR